MRTAKAWVAAAGLLVTALTGVFADDVFDIAEGPTLAATLVEAALAVFAVYQVKNKRTVQDDAENTTP